MSSNKGKGRASDEENGTLPDRAAQDSILSRVAASASGLTKSAFATPGNIEVSGGAAALLGGSGKGESSARTDGSSSTWAESSKTANIPDQKASLSNGFRVSESQEHVKQSEEDFSAFLDQTKIFTPSENMFQQGVYNDLHQVPGRSSSELLGEPFTVNQPAEVPFNDIWDRNEPPLFPGQISGAEQFAEAKGLNPPAEASLDNPKINTYPWETPFAFSLGEDARIVKEPGKSSFDDAWDRNNPPAFPGQQSATEQFAEARRIHDLQSKQPGPATVAEQQALDGTEVTNILGAQSSDTFQLPEPEVGKYDWGLTSEQIIQLRAMTKDLLPPAEAHGAVPPLDPLEQDAFWENFSSSKSYYMPKGPTGEGQEMVYLETAPGYTPDYNHLMKEWDGVLNRYTDEVWGDLLPLVEEARREVANKGGAGTEQPKALRRLVAILGHLGKR